MHKNEYKFFWPIHGVAAIAAIAVAAVSPSADAT